MLETLSRGFRSARLKLQGRTVLTEENIAEALRDVRVSLLEADVELGVVREFLDAVRTRSVGEVVPLRAGRGDGAFRVTPADHFVKICHDELVALMGAEEGRLDLSERPAAVMMVGLQGSGKTTTAGKIARNLIKEGKRPLLVAADIYRPAAVDQLMTIGRRVGVPVFFIKGQDPVALCELAMTQARSVGRDVVIFDTAGRLAIDETLMIELERIRERTEPANVLFVCDAMIGQDAVRTAAAFDRRLNFTGFVLTKLDGDARGGAALSIRRVTGKPILFVGMGEGLDRLEPFRAEGLAGRILGMGDVVGLMRDFENAVDRQQAEADAQKMLAGDFTFDTFTNQLLAIRKMGSLRDVVGKMPILSDLVDQLPEEALDDRELNRVEAIVQSMTRQERLQPDLINESRIRRIARGSGRSVVEVKALYDRFLVARQAMRQLGRASGLFGSLKQVRKARRMLGSVPGLDPGAFPAALEADEENALSPEEKIARRRMLQEARKARRRGRR
ncbi:MAG: signal recognition particle protein [Deltaproteobacteria bacterium]|nr:signal recognition particle protein [Deltaproteobacteria bacterium]